MARTKEGGHYVDPLTISANFYGNLEKLNRHYEMFDLLQIIDTSETTHYVIAVLTNGEIATAINKSTLPLWFKNSLPQIVGKIP